MQYEDELLQSLALSVLPLDALEAEAAETAAASAALGEHPPLAPADALALLLLEWFKRFFTWVCACCCAAFATRCHNMRDSLVVSRAHLLSLEHQQQGALHTPPGAHVYMLSPHRLKRLMQSARAATCTGTLPAYASSSHATRAGEQRAL